ncbi:unnamed protein product [Onchocerca flexuosa]|uniref:Uncharacterized protein n=1 Tax=Onchocerca flexuosa TaxID=387005 RepID=A0A183I5G6_9BILA|nr:unnamed protein product [Onchocerca flexuosa]
MAFLKRWCFTFVDYWKMVGNDYLIVIGDLLKDAKTKPIITAIKLLPLGGAFYAYKTNPTERDMLDSLIERRRQMVLLPNSIHNKRADDEIASRTLYIDQNRLKLINCILFSILIKLPDSDDVRQLLYFVIDDVLIFLCDFFQNLLCLPPIIFELVI